MERNDRDELTECGTAEPAQNVDGDRVTSMWREMAELNLQSVGQLSRQEMLMGTIVTGMWREMIELCLLIVGKPRLGQLNQQEMLMRSI